jgi:hypothetical protein
MVETRGVVERLQPLRGFSISKPIIMTQGIRAEPQFGGIKGRRADRSSKRIAEACVSARPRGAVTLHCLVNSASPSAALDAPPRLHPTTTFTSAAATASVGSVLAICDGIVPINDSMASIRGPRIRKKGLWSRAGRATVGRSSAPAHRGLGRTIGGQTFRSQSARRARPHESTQTRHGV